MSKYRSSDDHNMSKRKLLVEECDSKYHSVGMLFNNCITFKKVVLKLALGESHVVKKVGSGSSLS